MPHVDKNRESPISRTWILACCWLVAAASCASPTKVPIAPSDSVRATGSQPQEAPAPPIALASFGPDDTNQADAADDGGVPEPAEPSLSLLEFEALAQASNPTLRRLRQEVAAAYAKSGYANKLPDPTVGTNVFAHPIETAAGSQRANMMVMQMLPWLGRLNAQARQAYLEAMALQQQQEFERLKVVADVRATWYRLYVIEKQRQTTLANQEVMQSLLETVNATVAVGRASSNDVRLGTVEYGRLEKQLLTLNQQLATTKAELNRLVGRPADAFIELPQHVQVSLPNWSHEMLRQQAWENQPAVAQAQIQSQAARWGLEIARLKRRPDLAVSANWFAIDDNRPGSSLVDVGRDAWSIGATVSVPLWHAKYDAMAREASWRYSASRASVDEVVQRYDALLRDLWERAKAAHQTSRLYADTILPDAKQTLTLDQESYANGAVGFDRVLQDFRTILTLELGYHQAIGQLATALARIEQAIGSPIELVNRLE